MVGFTVAQRIAPRVCLHLSLSLARRARNLLSLASLRRLCRSLSPPQPAPKNDISTVDHLRGDDWSHGRVYGVASERSFNNLRRSNDFDLETKAQI